MTRLRFLADVISVSQAEDADNRRARRAFMVERIARFDPEVMGLMTGIFAGPENVPDDTPSSRTCDGATTNSVWRPGQD